MKRLALIACAAFVLLANSGVADAAWGRWGYSGYQPWWNPFAKRFKLTPEEERLQKFWHDYYDALAHYYGALDHIDWVAYYKNHGYAINQGGVQMPYGYAHNYQRINYAPVIVTPSMTWAVPREPLGGPPWPNGPQVSMPMAPVSYPVPGGY